MAGTLANWAAGAVGSLISYALPPRCPGCGTITEDDHRFCVRCWTALDFLGSPCCAICGDRLKADFGAGAACGACLADPPAFTTARAAVAYGDIARALALKLKHGRRPGVAGTVARQLDRFDVPDDALIAPVPLHRWRIWSRGYNQSALIARAIAARRSRALVIDLLWRTKPTPMLRGMGPAERQRTVRGAFRLNPAWRARIRDVPVVLIDDVYTTGATVSACAQVLRRAGARDVHVLTWARVLRDAVDN